MRFILLVFIGFLGISTLLAQDPHFSQFYSSPLTLNPALTGGLDGKYRAGFIYRDQWRQALDNPFATSGAFLDLRLNTPWKASRGDRIGVGANFYTDQVKSIGFVGNQMGFSGAYHKSLNFYNSQYLSVGSQVTFNQRSVNYNHLNFNDAFNGLDGYTFATEEALPENNFSYPDLAVGINYAISFDRVYALYVGGAAHHIIGPNVSFYKDPEIPRNTLARRYVAHAAGTLPVGERISFLPRIMFLRQGPLMQLNGGTSTRIVINHTDGTSLYLGAWGRGVEYQNEGVGLDAIIGLVGFEFNKVLAGFSYDLNIGSAGSGVRRNALEFSIIYLGEYENETILCPQF